MYNIGCRGIKSQYYMLQFVSLRSYTRIKTFERESHRVRFFGCLNWSMVRTAGYWEKWRGVSFASRRTGRRKGFAYAGTWSALTLVSLRFFLAEKRARFKFPRLFRGWPSFDRANVIRASALTSWSLLSEPTPELEFGGFFWQICQEPILFFLPEL